MTFRQCQCRSKISQVINQSIISNQSIIKSCFYFQPENILCINRTGNRIKIIDFGLARRFEPEKKLQILFGTPEFVAPEIVNFEPIGIRTWYFFSIFRGRGQGCIYCKTFNHLLHRWQGVGGGDKLKTSI